MADGTGAVLAGPRGWTWGTCCGIRMVWVREDQRRSGSDDVRLRKDL